MAAKYVRIWVKDRHVEAAKEKPLPLLLLIFFSSCPKTNSNTYILYSGRGINLLKRYGLHLEEKTHFRTTN